LFALLLLASSSGGTTFATLLAALGRLGILLVLVRVLASLLSAFLRSAGLGPAVVIIAFVVILASVFVVVILLDDLEVVLESEGDQLVLELVAHIEILIHQLCHVFLTCSLLVIFILLFARSLLAVSEFLLIGHDAGLEEVEEGFLFDDLGDGLAWLSLLCLLLLLDLLVGHVLPVLPLDLASLALLDHVLSLHCETLCQFLVLEVVVLLKGKDQVKTITWVMEFALNI